MSEYTEAELAMLSDEERAAIMDTSEDERKALNAVVNDGDDGDEGDPKAGEEGDPAPGDDADAKKAEGEDNDDGDDDEHRFVPRYQAEPVEDYAEQIKALDERFEDGSLDLKAYNTERETLLRRQLKAEIASEQQEQTERQMWEYEINGFLDDHKEYKESRLLHAALDAAVKDLGADEANADKSFRWFLREAHKNVQKAFGRQDKPAETPDNQDADAAKDVKKPKGDERKPDLSLVPKTLGNVPAAGGSDDGGEFADLDNLSGIELERALARLSDDQRNRYLAA